MDRYKAAPDMNDLVQEQEQEQEDGSGESSSSSTTDGFYINNTQDYIGSSFSSLSASSSSSIMLSTDLRLDLTLSSSSTYSSRFANYKSDGHEGDTYACNGKEEEADPSLLVKVYMEGIPIGRKLDLMTQRGYHTLLPTLSHMFNTPIYCSDVNNKGLSGREHVLTYEDNDGDWMLVGDVPWEMFLRTVKKLMITKPETC